MVVEGLFTMINDISLVAHQALVGGGVVAYDSLLNNVYGPSNASLNTSTTGDANTAIGFSALRENTTGIRNVGMGTTALRENQGGSFNTVLGYGAVVNIVDSSHNVAIGYSALTGLVGSWASRNVAIGSEAMKDGSGAYNNVAIGFQAARDVSDCSGLLVLNATGRDFPNAAEITAAGGAPAAAQDRFYVKPVREASQTNALYYNPTSGEVTHSGAAAALSFRVVRSMAAQVSANATLTAITTTFPSLPNDNRVISVTAWCGGDGTNVGCGVTFNIPSSEFRTWYWGSPASATNSASSNPTTDKATNLWNNSSASTANQNYEGFYWGGRGQWGASWVANGGVGGATDVLLWNLYGAAPGPGGGVGIGGKTPGQATLGAQMLADTYTGAGIKVQWIG